MKITENYILVFCLIAMSCMVLVYFISSTLAPQSCVIKYDCGMAEWHPDIPASVKEQCRQRYKQVA